MKKQFKSKDELIEWEKKTFPEEEKEWTFGNVAESFAGTYPSQKEIAAKLIEEGYDLDDLTANGEAYEIDGHTNNGWFWACKDELSWLESVGTDMSKVRVRK